jgi:hypothetical protein
MGVKIAKTSTFSGTFGKHRGSATGLDRGLRKRPRKYSTIFESKSWWASNVGVRATGEGEKAEKPLILLVELTRIERATS